MAETPITLNNYSDDSQIKAFMNTELATRVFHDIPLNVLNSGMFSLTTEYISQITEQLAFTSSFYFNESFITKAVLPDSIYAEAAIFNIGYSFANPASSNFLLELRIEDIINNSVYNANNGLYEFILDKNTKFNLPEGFIYSLDYDILIQYKNEETAMITAVTPAWNVQYINKDQVNMCATNKDTYLHYRVTDNWLCIFVQANEYERQVHTVTNNTNTSIPNEDTVITCNDHIAGFDIKYIDGDGNEKYLTRDHILTIHGTVNDLEPYVNYIMDNPQTIRFMWQLAGTKYFTPAINSSYEITIYTCHGRSANAPNYSNDTQPKIITASNKYTNNANVTKAVFVLSGCVGGTDIGTTETVRRETIEAYNTANVISTDHDIDEWIKTFYFKELLYPYFFKRRDDPWGRIWSGYFALNNEGDDVYKTNTLHGKMTYDQLYSNSNNTISNNEIIIPAGWLWTYVNDDSPDEGRCTVHPCVKNTNKNIIENAKSLININEKFVFANPFGIRIQKEPFAIGYFNPWVNQYVSGSHLDSFIVPTANIYHASHIISHVKRTYIDDYYDITSSIDTNVSSMINTGEPLLMSITSRAVTPNYSDSLWTYFKHPLDDYASDIPFMVLTEEDGALPFDPEKTYIYCNGGSLIQSTDDPDVMVFRITDSTKTGLPTAGLCVKDFTNDPINPKITTISISGMTIYCKKSLWTDTEDHKVYPTGETEITLEANDESHVITDYITFTRIPTMNYYEMRLVDNAHEGTISRITVTTANQTDLIKYGQDTLTKIGNSYSDTGVTIVVTYNVDGEESDVEYTIYNAANVYMPYECPTEENGIYTFILNNLEGHDIILYADMKPSPESGAVQYYRIPFSEISSTTPAFYIHSNQLDLSKNNLRVLLTTISQGSETGRVEMLPVRSEADGTYTFNTRLYPLTELIDIDNRITIASLNNGGGSWKELNGNVVTIDALDPHLKMSILIRNENQPDCESPIPNDNRYIGYTIIDEYMLDDLNLIQELKEMRSVVDFGPTTTPTTEILESYDHMVAIDRPDEDDQFNLYYMTEYAYNRKHNIAYTGDDTDESFIEFQNAAESNKSKLLELYDEYEAATGVDKPSTFNKYIILMDSIISFEEYSQLTDEPTDFNPVNYYKLINDEYVRGNVNDTWDSYIWYTKNVFDWDTTYTTLSIYPHDVSMAFEPYNVNGAFTIQLIPFVARSLMISEEFENFVATFTNIHKAIEPVIFERLEGNNYLDCKLIATYGKPRSYSADLDVNDINRYWPDLNVQIEFDVKLYNLGLEKTTINDLKTIIRSYFNRITTVHTPTQDLDLDNNIYISNLIQLMEEHDNVAWLKFKGWYTDEKGNPHGNYMDPSVQAIEQKWRKFEDMPNYKYLERYVPEMFVLEDGDIVINIIK